MAKARILIVDDDVAWTQLVSDLCLHDDYDVLSATAPREAFALLQVEPCDLIVADVNFPGTDGNAFLEQLRKLHGATPLIVCTAEGGISQAVLATRLGAIDYLVRSADAAWVAGLRDRINGALQRAAPLPATVGGDGSIPTTPVEGFYGIISQNPQMRDIFELIQTIADSYANVLIHGETGTGKELVARAIHNASERHAKPFVTVDCSILARELMESELFGHERGAFTGATDRHIGRFERANGGTLLLDEVANIPLAIQAKLLRVLQERTFERVGGQTSIAVNVRIVAATNRRLEQAVALGTFRDDLYHRLNVVQIDLPALRERAEDIPLLAGEFLRRFARQNAREARGFTEPALRALLAYRWPGNVRELENVVLQAVVLTKTPFIDLGDLPKRVTQAPVPATATALADQLGEPEREILLRALRQHHGNIKRAAALLQISRTTLYAKLRKYGIEPDAIR